MDWFKLGLSLSKEQYIEYVQASPEHIFPQLPNSSALIQRFHSWLFMQHEFGEELCTNPKWESETMVRTQITANPRGEGIQVTMFEYQTYLNFINYCCWWDIEDANSEWPGNREKITMNTELKKWGNGREKGRELWPLKELWEWKDPAEPWECGRNLIKE